MKQYNVINSQAACINILALWVVTPSSLVAKIQVEAARSSVR
jgi:hypothetical protein